MLHSQLAQILNKVESKAVVVIYNKKHRTKEELAPNQVNKGGKIKRNAIINELIEATKTAAAEQSLAMRAKG